MVEHVTAAIRKKNDAYDNLEAAERAALKIARAAGVAWSREDDAVDVDVCGVVLTVETMDIVRLGMCAEVRIERGQRLVSKGRCYMGQMPSLRSCVARALEGAIGGALLAGVPADELVEAGRRVLDDDYAWARAEPREDSWESVERVYR